MKKNIAVLINLLLFATVLSSGYALEFFTDFKDASTLKCPAGEFLNPEQLHFVDTADGKAMELKRGRDKHTVKLVRPLEKNEDFTYSFDLTRTTGTSAICVGLQGKKDKYFALLLIPDSGYVNVYNSKLQRYSRTNIFLAPRVKHTVKAAYCADTKTLTVSVSGQEPHFQLMHEVDGLDKLIIYPQGEKDSINLIENFHFLSRNGRIVSRENGAKKSPVESADYKAENLAKITDGNYSDCAALNENALIEFALPKRINATAIQIYGGDVATRLYPSSACSPKSYLIEGYCNGAWMTLAKTDNAPDPCIMNGLAPEERFVRHDFPLAPIDRVRIKFNTSYDTGKRQYDDAVKNRKLYIREIEIFSDKQIASQIQLTSLIAADFHLPVYRNAQKADLTLHAVNSPITPLKGTITIKSPDGKTVRTMNVSWKHGQNNIIIDDIGGFSPGRYMATLTTEAGKMSRLLRIEKSPEIAAPAAPLQMSGKKLFFTPDKFTFSAFDNLSVVIGKTEVFKHTQTPSPDTLVMSATNMFKTKDGRYAISVIDRPYKSSRGKNSTIRHLVSDSILGPFIEVEKRPAAAPKFSPLKEFHKNNFRRTSHNKKLELYDPAVHGKIELTKLSYHYNYAEEDLGCIIAAPRHYYVIGTTKNGKQVVMNKNHIFYDHNYFGENDFDNGFMTNDNFGGMWLSPDGKECFWAQGQTVKRSAPYSIEYDNLPTAARLLTVYSSTDGINWQLRNVMSVPDETDSISAQHYGAHVLQLAHGDLFIAEMFNYDAVAQQIYIELIYSRDGVNFHRFDDRTPFIRGKDPDSWYYGHIFTNYNYIKEGNYYYQQASYCTPNPHFYWEVVSNIPNNAAARGEMFRNRFVERDIKNWPFFDKVGGFEGMAEYTRKGFYASGVVRFRADGWFGVRAQDSTGTFSTNLLNAKGKLTANAEIAENGFIKFKICTPDGKVVEEKTVKGNSLNLPVFDKLPDGNFFIKASMKNAMLYTLNFE